MRGGIGRTFIVFAVALSALLTLGTTAYQLHAGYRGEVAHLNDQLDRLAVTHIDALSDAVWSYEEPQIERLLEGIVAIHDFGYARVELDGSRYEAGAALPADGRLERTFALEHSAVTVGQLSVQATAPSVIELAMERFYLLLATNALVIALAAGVIVLLVYYLVTRHLEVIAAFARRFSLDGADKLELNRRRVSSRTDEFDEVVSAINQMVQRIEHQQVELKEALDSARAAARAKEAFLSNLSHEIRTPLNGVIGSAALLDNGSLDTSQADLLQTIRESGQTLERTIGDVLEFSRLEYDKPELVTSDFHLKAILNDAVRQIAPAATCQGVRLEVHLDDDLPPRLHGPGQSVSQVLVHLLGNAIKFSADADVVRLNVTLDVEATDPPPAVSVCFEVVDRGTGMSSEMQAQLFVPFTQADTSMSRRHGGTGLGLAICDRLVRLMNGDMEVESAPGAGSIFRLVVPMALALVEAPESQQAAAGEQADAVHLLVAEDNAINRKVLGRQLERLGYSYDMANDGAEALALYEPARHGLLLTDCDMPNCDGFELTARIRAGEPEGTRLPIIAVTANAFGGGEERCIEAGMDDYLGKPLELDALAAALRRWSCT